MKGVRIRSALVFNKITHTPNTYFRTFIGLMTTYFALTGLFFFESYSVCFLGYGYIYSKHEYLISK
jgi:hypothetical protein